MTVPEPPLKHTSPLDTPQLPITLFVYGTLKRGYWNHDHYCRNAIDVRPATTWGRLYQLPAGYPALEVPKSHILAHGTADPIADALTQARLAATNLSFERPAGDWDEIHGELITLPDPALDLPPIDQLEGFRVGETCLYERVLLCALRRGRNCIAWVYCTNSRLGGIRLGHGRWN